MATAINWVQQRQGHLEAFKSFFVSDYVTFQHMLKIDADVMVGRKPKDSNPLDVLGANSLKIAAESGELTQQRLKSNYDKVFRAKEAVCTTFAFAAAYVLAAPSGPTVEVVAHNAKKKHSGTHLFVVVGRGGGAITNPSWVTDTVIIVDCWYYALGASSVYWKATAFKASPIKAEAARLEVVFDASAVATGVPILNGAAATGTKKKGCYITTATCVSLGLGEDCEALATLRMFRDEVLMRTDAGRRDVDTYYALAPRIVERIDRRADRERIYAEIYERTIRPAVSAVKSGEHAHAHELFRALLSEMAHS